jgi:hypothetical protein
LDVATNEIHMTFVLLEKGEGIRRKHVAQGFEAMVADWGLPEMLYLDALSCRKLPLTRRSSARLLPAGAVGKLCVAVRQVV